MPTVRLPADTTSPRWARRFVVDSLKGEGVAPGLVDDAALLANELVTNVIIHAHTAMVLTVEASEDGVHIAVTDFAPDADLRLLEPRTDEPTGRGLFLVDRLATAWEVTYDDNGTTVACRLDGSEIADS